MPAWQKRHPRTHPRATSTIKPVVDDFHERNQRLVPGSAYVVEIRDQRLFHEFIPRQQAVPRLPMRLSGRYTEARKKKERTRPRWRPAFPAIPVWSPLDSFQSMTASAIEGGADFAVSDKDGVKKIGHGFRVERAGSAPDHQRIGFTPLRRQQGNRASSSMFKILVYESSYCRLKPTTSNRPMGVLDSREVKG